MNPVKISGCIITFNEASNIKRCIESLQPVCDEIVVVDSYSTDVTLKICEELKVNTFQNPFKGHIEQKNFALSKCRNNWVISLDADECLTAELQQSIAAESFKDEYMVYSFNRLTNFCGQWIRHCGWYPDKKVRLFHKLNAYWGGKNPHDRIEYNRQTKVANLKGDLLHYSFNSVSEHVAQINKFSSIGAQSAFENQKKPNLLWQVILDPLYTFIKKYIFQLGFLDGYYGFVISINTAHSKFLKYVKLRDLYKAKSKL